jgi:hypothetical protein
MVRYFYAWTPLGIIGALFLLALPWLGLIALLIVSVVAVPALALAIVVAPYLLIQAIARRWHRHTGATAQPTTVSSRPSARPTFEKGFVS